MIALRAAVPVEAGIQARRPEGKCSSILSASSVRCTPGRDIGIKAPADPFGDWEYPVGVFPCSFIFFFQYKNLLGLILFLRQNSAMVKFPAICLLTRCGIEMIDFDWIFMAHSRLIGVPDNFENWRR